MTEASENDISHMAPELGAIDALRHMLGKGVLLTRIMEEELESGQMDSDTAKLRAMQLMHVGEEAAKLVELLDQTLGSHEFSRDVVNAFPYLFFLNTRAFREET